ncbi:uncharacterized protein LOC133285146 [Gastrolobium bilobum]|uniref:uncharacterized protein LOC133285146 n=1 Tax=Gastrolobium bilobum TaxID=150636 RepID=UPI002AB00F01|nr:uncharacterized protein LOC133285146 [Gastrolobium bilobum]
MEPGEQSNGKGKRKSDTEDISELTRKTIDKIKKVNPRDRLQHGTKCTFHDMTSIGYGWLLPGWVAEERHTQRGRIYRYYYDPNGNFYETQRQVVAVLEKCGVVVIDKECLFAKSEQECFEIQVALNVFFVGFIIYKS